MDALCLESPKWWERQLYSYQLDTVSSQQSIIIRESPFIEADEWTC